MLIQRVKGTWQLPEQSVSSASGLSLECLLSDLSPETMQLNYNSISTLQGFKANFTGAEGLGDIAVPHGSWAGAAEPPPGAALGGVAQDRFLLLPSSKALQASLTAAPPGSGQHSCWLKPRFWVFTAAGMFKFYGEYFSPPSLKPGTAAPLTPGAFAQKEWAASQTPEHNLKELLLCSAVPGMLEPGHSLHWSCLTLPFPNSVTMMNLSWVS